MSRTYPPDREGSIPGGRTGLRLATLVYRTDAQGQALGASHLEAGIRHELEERRPLREAPHRLGQVTVRLPLSGHDAADKGQNEAEVETVQVSEPGQRGLGEIENQQLTTTDQNPPGLPQPGRNVSEVADPEGGGHQVEAAVPEGQLFRVTGHQPSRLPPSHAAGSRFADAEPQHGQSHVHADDALRPQSPGGQSEVPGACCQIQHSTRTDRAHQGEGAPTPIQIYAGAQQVIEQIVAQGDGVEHRLDAPLALDGDFAILRRCRHRSPFASPSLSPCAPRVSVCEGASCLENEQAYRLPGHVSNLNTLSAQTATDMLSRLSEGVLLFDGDGRVLFGNPAAYRLLSLDRQTSGRLVSEILDADCELAGLARRALVGETAVDQDVQHTPPSGDTRWLRTSFQTLTAAASHPALVLLALREISELKRAEREMWQAEKMSALGRLASSVAHEVRNPLGAVDIQLQLLQEDLADLQTALPRRVGERLNTARAEMRRLDGIVQNFLRFSRPPALNLQRVGANDLLAHIVALVEPEARERQIALELELADDLPLIMADDNLLSQAILNVIINAFQAVGKEPAVLLGTHLDKDSGHVQFRVADNGSGIAAADLERVFEYYYTTKDTGTGLGLSITQRIVHQHQGLIDVESAVGSGTAVTISLPPG